MFEQDQQLSARRIRRKHGREHRQGDSGLMAKLRNAAPTGIEERVGQSLGRQGIMLTIVVANPCSESLVARIAAELFDPGVLIRRNRLRGELAADPVGGLGQDHRQPLPQRRQRRRAASQPTPHDHQVGRKLTPSASLSGLGRVNTSCGQQETRSARIHNPRGIVVSSWGTVTCWQDRHV